MAGAAVLLADAVARYRNRTVLRNAQTLGLYGALTFLYVAMAMSQEKTAFQGSLFYLPAIVATLHALAHLIKTANEHGRGRWINPVLAGTLVVCVAALPIASDYSDTPPHTPSFAALGQVADVIVAHYHACPDEPHIVTTLNPQPFAGEVLSLELARRGFPAHHRGLAFERDQQMFVSRALESSLIIMPSQYPTLDRRMPTYPMIPAAEQAIDAAPNRTAHVVSIPGDLPISISLRSCS